MIGVIFLLWKEVNTRVGASVSCPASGQTIYRVLLVSLNANNRPIPMDFITSLYVRTSTILSPTITLPYHLLTFRFPFTRFICIHCPRRFVLLSQCFGVFAIGQILSVIRPRSPHDIFINTDMNAYFSNGWTKCDPIQLSRNQSSNENNSF